MRQRRRFIALTRCDGACCRDAGCLCRARFRYGSDGQRTRSWGADGARVYLPGYEHRTDTGETKVYVGDYAVISRTGATRTVEYLLKDRLGSVDAVANSSGTVTETRGYDAFGKPRDGSWNDLAPAKIASTVVTPKGFTQHEHLNQLELIHMNGRAYDYHLGRFTGVDPFIQFPLNSQSLNPYSYILNNPLSGTDPTGYQSRGSVCAIGTSGNANGCISGAGSDIPTGTEKINKPGKRPENDRGKSPTTNSGNGGSNTQGTTGAGGRKNQAANASEKSAATNSSAIGENIVDSLGASAGYEQRKEVRGDRNTEDIVPADPDVVKAATLDAEKAMASIYGKGGYRSRDEMAKELDEALAPLTDRWHIEFGLKIFEQSGIYYPGTLVVGNEICTPNNVCGVNIGLSEFSGAGKFYVAGDYHSHPAITGKGFSYSDVVSSFVTMRVGNGRSGSMDYISYVSSKYFPLEAIDYSRYVGKDPDYIYYDSKKNSRTVR